MKKIFLKYFILLLFIMAASPGAVAQQDISDFISGSISDIRLLIENYAAPFIKGEGHAVGNGWYSSAKAHKPFDFDFTVTMNSAFLPEQERFFRFIPSNYSFLELRPGEENRIPTAVGPDRPGPVLQSLAGNVAFNTPEGAGFPLWEGRVLAFMPIAQIGVGLVGKTDAKFRYWPEIKIGKSTNKAIGFALMHEAGQWVPLFKKLGMNGSVLAGYTRIESSYDFSSGGASLPSQQSGFIIKSYTAQLVLSKDISKLAVFIGGGINYVDSRLSYEGFFKFTGPGGETFEGIIEPVAVSLDYMVPVMALGGQLKLSFLVLQAAYALTDYPVGTLGASISID